MKSTHKSLICQTFRPCLAIGLFGFFLIVGCVEYGHPDLQVREVGWQPDRDLTPFLNTDSMIRSLGQVRSTNAKLDSLLEWTDMLNYRHKEEGLIYANEAYRLAVEKQQRFSQVISMYYRAKLKSQMQIFGEGIEDALGDAMISHRLLIKTDEPSWQIRINMLLGYIYYRNRRLDASFVDSAEFYGSHALELTKKTDLPKREAAYFKSQLFQDLTYTLTDSTDKIDFFRESISAAEESGNLALLAVKWRGLGNFYLREGNKSMALSAFLKSRTYAEISKDTINIFHTYQRLADVLGQQYDETGQDSFYLAAKRYLDKCLEMPIEENSYYTYALMAWNVGDKFYRINGVPPTGYSPEGDSLIQLYVLAIEEAQKEGATGFMRSAVIDISNFCDFKSRFTSRDCSELLGGKAYNQYLIDNYDELVKAMRNEFKEVNDRIRYFEQRVLEADNNRKFLRNWLISGISLAGAVITFLILLQIQQRKRFQARLDALRAQINPHFISNSLNAIESLVNLDKRQEASKYLIHFSRLSRKILNHSRDASTSLAEEIQTLKHFLALEQLRFRDKLTYEIELAPEIDPESLQVPALILQPYVENAIIHGIKPKSGPGQVKIILELKGKKLLCIVEDDGIGRKQSAVLRQKSLTGPHKHRSEGMKISEERLRMIGKARRAKVEIIDLKDDQGHPSGTQVWIYLPIKRN